jgi:hypothetical protein
VVLLLALVLPCLPACLHQLSGIMLLSPWCLLARTHAVPAAPAVPAAAACCRRCKRNEVPMEKVFNKSLLSKFLWAMDVEPEFRF